MEEPEKVDKIQNHFLECLLYVIEENRGKSQGSKSFRHIVHALTGLRQSKFYSDKFVEKCMEISTSGQKFPELIVQVYDFPDSLVDELETDMGNLQIHLQ